MMSAIVPLWVYSSCRKLYNNKLSKVHMCAGGLGTDTCQVSASPNPDRPSYLSLRATRAGHSNAAFQSRANHTDAARAGLCAESPLLARAAISQDSPVSMLTSQTRASWPGFMIGLKYCATSNLTRRDSACHVKYSTTWPAMWRSKRNLKT